MQISKYINDNYSWISLMMNDDNEFEMSEKEDANKKKKKAKLSMYYWITIRYISMNSWGIYTYIQIDKEIEMFT